METTFQLANRLTQAIRDGKATHESAAIALGALKEQWEMVLDRAEQQQHAEGAWRAWRNVGHAKLVLTDFRAAQGCNPAEVFAALAVLDDESRLLFRYARADSREQRSRLADKLADLYDMPLPLVFSPIVD